MKSARVSHNRLINNTLQLFVKMRIRRYVYASFDLFQNKFFVDNYATTIVRSSLRLCLLGLQRIGDVIVLSFITQIA